ncbi:DNA-3-methyladenine glycosylase I [Epilithonimonas zeae]|uniref:DNA-3-methyladenine glycosylase I n=2 Tax=Epilithonimonas zeae TaxID=1416779 RepID=A0A1N6EBJ0_9FLAO|nr:DNA-3-methyladenine glycosylase I [Epilithonimonas zeae]
MFCFEFIMFPKLTSKLKAMEKIRCAWCGTDELYQKYHDEEWGRLVTDDATMFEFLILESFQAGLSWITILRKRETFGRAFDNFDYKKIAKYGEDKVEELMQDTGIVRNRLKVNAAISNAQKFMELQKEFGSFYNYISTFTGGSRIVNAWKVHTEAPATTELSDAISKDLKKRGFKFLGSTVIYSHLQATGIVDDHIESCFVRNTI